MTTYLELDFSTFKEKMKEVLSNSDTFKDYDYEGSNISVLLEVLAYMMEFNTYYQNKIVDNIFFDTATLYNTVHRLASLVGYKPTGYVSPYTNLKITIDDISPYLDEQMFIPEYTVFKTEDELEFITTKNHTISIPSTATSPYSFYIGVKEGTHERLTYTGRDLVDYSIYLPLEKYDNDSNIVNDEFSVKLYVNMDLNQEPWTRVPDIFQEISGLSSLEDVYTFEYDKYKNYVVRFSFSRNYPLENDEITIDLIKTNGVDGNAGKNEITAADTPFITVNNQYISLENITITNENATRGASDPETIEEIKSNAKSNFNAQYRCVTKADFQSYIESRNDVVSAHIWGEKEELEGEQVDAQLYNKTYISIIPDVWNSNTIELSGISWDVHDDATKIVSIEKPLTFSDTFKYDISHYIESRKLMNSFEIYIVPELIYFYFDMALILKESFSFNNVQNAIKKKIQHYFLPKNRDFNETIDFRDINNFIKDTTVESPYTDIDYRSIYGIKSLVFRDIKVINSTTDDTNIYSYTGTDYPKYDSVQLDNDFDNILKPIILGFNQFPMITYNSISITNEG